MLVQVDLWCIACVYLYNAGLLKPVSHKVNILSIYGKMIEQLDYPAPLAGIMEPNVKQGHQCPEDLQEFALHHKVHRHSSRKDIILDLESTFRRLKQRGSVPKAELRLRYRDVVSKAETEIIHKGDFDIVLCTCSEAASGRVKTNLSPVQCIIDEAAMAMEPECLAAISKAYHVVLIGDHKQLQPVIDNRKAKENGLGTSLFERYAMLESDGSTPTLPFITLEVQYRMVSCFCAPIAKCITYLKLGAKLSHTAFVQLRKWYLTSSYLCVLLHLLDLSLQGTSQLWAPAWTICCLDYAACTYI